MDRWIFEVLLDGVWVGVSQPVSRLPFESASEEELIRALPTSFFFGITDREGNDMPGRLRNVNTNETIPWEAIR